MTKEEATKFLALIKVAYPNSYRDMDDDMVHATINMWHTTFSNTPYAVMQICFDKYRRENKFPPTVADIIESLKMSYYASAFDANIAWSNGDRDTYERCRYVMSHTQEYRGGATGMNLEYRHISNEMLLESKSKMAELISGKE